MQDHVESQSVDAILGRADEHVAAGRKWRAKEVLQGAIREHPTSPALLRAYGRLLDDLGDRVEAGKYLFLAGDRSDAALAAINLFFERFGRTHPNDLVAQFPGILRNQRLGQLPQVVLDELEVRGAKIDRSMTLEKSVSRHPRSGTMLGQLLGQLLGWVVALAAVLVVFVLIGGMLRLALTVFDYLVSAAGG